jgi:hypothetical protein
MVLAFAVLVAVSALDAQAQNRLAVEVGPLFPLGSFSDGHETSLYVGARFEFQNVNALGGVAVLSYTLNGGFAVLNVDSALESSLEQLGESTSSSLVNAGAGVRAYSQASPLFFSLSVDYVNFNLPGDADSESGVDAALGLGLVRDLTAVVAELEFKGHAAFFSGADDLQYLILQVNLAIPF